MCKDPTPIEHFWLMQMLGNFGAKRNLYFLPLSLSKNRFRATVLRWLIFIDAKTISAFKKNWNIARNKICFIVNVVIAQAKMFSPSYLSFSKFSYRQNMF